MGDDSTLSVATWQIEQWRGRRWRQRWKTSFPVRWRKMTFWWEWRWASHACGSNHSARETDEKQEDRWLQPPTPLIAKWSLTLCVQLVIQGAKEGSTPFDPMRLGSIRGKSDGEHVVGWMACCGQRSFSFARLVDRAVVIFSCVEIKTLQCQHLMQRSEN